MKKIITIALWALLPGLPAGAQKNIYHIDGKRVENFDGSQLIGRTIKHYEIKTLPDRQTTFHHIFTTDDWIKVSGTNTLETIRVDTLKDGQSVEAFKGRMKEMRNPLLVVDGKVFKGKMSDIKSDDIKSIEVYEAGSDEARAYGEEGKNGVLKIFTESLPKAITYVIDGKRVSKSDFTLLAPDKIERIKVLKRGTALAIKENPKDGKVNDIYIITTKK